jgi:hypothetical protein
MEWLTQLCCELVALGEQAKGSLRARSSWDTFCKKRGQWQVTKEAVTINISEFGFLKILNNEKHLLVQDFQVLLSLYLTPNVLLQNSMARYKHDIMVGRNAQHIKSCLGQREVLSSQEGLRTNTQMWPSTCQRQCKGKHLYDWFWEDRPGLGLEFTVYKLLTRR